MTTIDRPAQSASPQPYAPRRLPLPQCSHTPQPYSGPPKTEVLADRQTYLSPGIFGLYQDPLMLVEGHMQYVWDETGTRYLDAYGGIVSISVGHCHPKVVAKVRAEADRLTHATTLYLHPTIGAFAKKLAQHFPPNSNLTQTYFTNSGSESNDIALLCAREFTGSSDIISLRNGYHGGSSATMGATATSAWKYRSNLSVNNKFTTPGYCYRCPFGLTYPNCDLKCARDTEEVIRYETNGQIAAFIAEPIQGVGGVVVPPPDYFKIVYEIVRQHGGICIADEVQTGFGRTGDRFWGFENWGVTPDIVTMAKGIGNGIPLGAATFKPEIAAVMNHRHHFNTFAGNPVSMAQGLATLEVIDEENIQQNARTVGNYLKSLLLELADKHPLIGEVRGLGLMLGIELVTDPKSKQPATSQTAHIVELARTRQLLLGKGGFHSNIIRIKPPMCLTKDDAAYLAQTLDDCLNLATP